MGGIAVETDGLSFFGEDRLLRKIGENEHECAAGCAGYLMAKASAVESNGVDAGDDSVGAIEIEFSLIHLQEVAFELEITVAGAAGGKSEE